MFKKRSRIRIESRPRGKISSKNAACRIEFFGKIPLFQRLTLRGLITGIYEHDIIEEENIYGDDNSKIAALFSKIGVVIPHGFTLTRIGKQKDNYNRFIKIDVNNKDNRDSVMNNAKLLKNAIAPWDKVYIKKDLHPVLVQENNRLRQKKKKVQNLPENNNKEEKLENGELKVDDMIIDQNLFFNRGRCMLF